MGWRSDYIIVLHAGNMGLKQGLEQVVDAAKAVPVGLPVRFVLMGDGSQRALLEERGKNVGALSFLPFQPEAEVSDILAAADVLLVSERSSVVDMSLPSKLTSYLVAGRPILAAVRLDGATAAEVTRAGAGVIVAPDSPGDLLQAVGDLAARPDAMQAYGDAGRGYAATALGTSAAFARADTFLAGLLGPAERDLAEA